MALVIPSNGMAGADIMRAKNLGEYKVRFPGGIGTVKPSCVLYLSNVAHILVSIFSLVTVI